MKNIRVFQRSTGYYLRVKVNGESVQTVNPRSKDWPRHDSNPDNCTGQGQATCLQQGQHSWFNHAMDNAL